jgi:hypothetical protein
MFGVATSKIGVDIMAFITKLLISALLIAAISEISKRSPFLGAVVASLPLISVLAVMWLWRDTGDVDLVASHLQSTFWMVLPSLPMFLVIPYLLRSHVGFWPSLGAGLVLTMSLYGALIMGARFLKIAL